MSAFEHPVSSNRMTARTDGTHQYRYSSGLVFIGLHCAAQLQYPLPEAFCGTVDRLEQTLVVFASPGLIEEVDLRRVGLLPVGDAHANEPHGFALQVGVKKKRTGLPQDHPFVVGRDCKLVLAGVGLKTFETDLQCYD